jgi:hypothetical protein
MNTIKFTTVELTYLGCEGAEWIEKAQVACEWAIKFYIV